MTNKVQDEDDKLKPIQLNISGDFQVVYARSYHKMMYKFAEGTWSIIRTQKHKDSNLIQHSYTFG